MLSARSLYCSNNGVGSRSFNLRVVVTLGANISLTKQESGITSSTWTQNKTEVTNGIRTLQVGDYVDYVSNVSGYTDTNGWRVLGAENGQLLLMSTRNITCDTASTPAQAYTEGINYITTACAPYKNETYATEARGIEIEDINRVTGYKPETAGYANGSVRYGETYTFSWVDSTVHLTQLNYSGYPGPFTMPDGRVLGTDMESEPIPMTYYKYYPNTLTTSGTGTTVGIEAKSTNQAYNMLFLEQGSTSTNSSYVLASQCINVSYPFTSFGLRLITGGYVDMQSMFYSCPGPSGSTTHVGTRCVVALRQDVSVNKVSAGNWTIQGEGVAEWEIK